MKLSIITINRNNAEGLRKTMQSIVSQNFTDFEYIIIDGGSTDGSIAPLSLPEGGKLCEVLRIDNGYHYCNWVTPFGIVSGGFISEPDSGIYNAMNKGILRAKGEYCLFINSGDYLYNNEVLKNAFAFDFHEDIVYGSVVNINAEGVTDEIEFPPEQYIDFDWFIHSTIPHGSSFIKRKLFDIVTFYSENYKIVSDWEFFLVSICKHNCTLKRIQLPIYYYDTTGISSNGDYKDLIENERNTVLNNHFSKIINPYNALLKQKKDFEVFRKTYIYKIYKRIKALYDK